MFDCVAFKSVISSHNKNMEDIAKIIGVNPATLYRKVSGVSDFTRNEIQLFKNALGLDNETVNNIFFAQ